MNLGKIHVSKEASVSKLKAIGEYCSSLIFVTKIYDFLDRPKKARFLGLLFLVLPITLPAITGKCKHQPHRNISYSER